MMNSREERLRSGSSNALTGTGGSDLRIATVVASRRPVVELGTNGSRESEFAPTVCWRPCALVLVLALCALAHAEVIFTDDFEQLNPRWEKAIRGDASIEIARGGVTGNCLKITSQGGYAYYTTHLDPARHAGATVEIRAMVKLDDMRVGPQPYSTAKYHIGQNVEGHRGVINRALWFTGTHDWRLETFKVDLDEKATAIVLDLGVQNGTGTVYFDNFVLQDTFGTGRPVSLDSVANAGRSDGVAGDGKGSFLDTGMVDLFGLPTGNLETETVTFYVPNHGDNAGRTCVLLKGRERPDFPARTKPIPVGQKVAALHFLHAAAWTDVDAKEPVLSYVVVYEDGKRTRISINAGEQIGNYDAPIDLPEWKIVWRGEVPGGKQVGAGMTSWTNPRPEVPVKSVAIISEGNGVPIVLAVTYTRPGKG